MYLLVCCLGYLVKPTGLIDVPVGMNMEEGGLSTAVLTVPIAQGTEEGPGERTEESRAVRQVTCPKAT